MAGRAALAHELSCRWVTPLLDLVEAEGRTAGLDALLGALGGDARRSSRRVELGLAPILRGSDRLAGGRDRRRKAGRRDRARHVFAARARRHVSGVSGLRLAARRVRRPPPAGPAPQQGQRRHGGAGPARRRRADLSSGRARAQGALAAHLPDAQGAGRRRADALEPARGARRGERVSGARRRGLPLQHPLGRAALHSGVAARPPDRRRDRARPGARPLGGARRALRRGRAGTHRATCARTGASCRPSSGSTRWR